MNTLRTEPLESLLAKDFTYESQAVFQALDSKQAFLDYIRPKLQTIARAPASVYAEMGMVSAYGNRQPCVVLAQNEKTNLVGLVLAKGKRQQTNLTVSIMVSCIISPATRTLAEARYQLKAELVPDRGD